MATSTIIYYTSNREDERFETKIRAKLLEAAGDMPIISVSQKPIDLGTNICVGEVGVSNQNAHRQFQLGAKHARTPFVHAAEADCLYPREYFDFVPPTTDRAYRTEIYLYRPGDRHFYRKRASECSTVVGREYVIRAIDKSLRNRGEWVSELETGKAVPYTFRHDNWEPFTLTIPIINIKTDKGMHAWHGTMGRYEQLPYWGTPDDVLNLIT